MLGLAPWAAAVLAGCATHERAQPAAGEGAGDVPGVHYDDRDGDGLCDVTEEIAGTDPDDPDTDDDTLPDVLEVAYDFGPTDPNRPAEDQVGYLEAEPGSTLDFGLRTTVDGDGQGHTGLFRAQASLYDRETTAETFFRGSVAVSADPSDNVRGVEADASRFGSVLGSTRLAFSLRFEVPSDYEADDCARAYPFRYELKADDGESRAERQYLLVVAPAGSDRADQAWCELRGCY
jgi:hypothetical protein